MRGEHIRRDEKDEPERRKRHKEMGGTQEMYLREKKQYVRRGVKRPEQRGIRVEHRRKDGK